MGIIIHSMNILFLSGRELSYSRNALMIRLLGNNHHIKSIGQSHGKASIIKQSLLGVIKTPLYLIRNQVQLIVVGFFGQFLVIPIGLITRKPILFDAFISAYDTLCFDRKIINKDSLTGKFTHWLDRNACMIADRIILDTQSHIDYFRDEFHIPNNKFDVLRVGCDDQIFFPCQVPTNPDSILFYGSFLPLHGVDVIFDAVDLVLKQNPNAQFRLVGADRKDLKKYHNRWVRQQNITISPPVELTKLPEIIASSTICLGGHFGCTPKASRVIAGKTYQCIAMGKPVIVGDNPANRELLTHGEDAWMCRMNDPQALAEAILLLLGNAGIREQLGQGARRTYLQKASNPVLQLQLDTIIKKMQSV